MPNICYTEKKFTARTLEVIEQAVKIIVEYQQQGFSLTLRQLYYQFVARDLIANEQREYKRLGGIVSDARLAGYVDWSSIEDRTRELQQESHWSSPSAIVRACADQYLIDKWAPQSERVEVWIEKDALTGVIDRVCKQHDTAYFSCRGYVSQSEMWVASQRLLKYISAGQRVTILHMGDHDPSGLDMTRDIRDRLSLFLDHEGGADDFEVNRIALTMAQVRQHNPPPNPTKLTDSRASEYVVQYGNDSWELDALDPQTLAGLIQKHIGELCDGDKWEDSEVEEHEGRQRLEVAADDMEDEP